MKKRREGTKMEEKRGDGGGQKRREMKGEKKEVKTQN